MTRRKIRALVAATALSAGALTFAGAAQAFVHGGGWHGGPMGGHIGGWHGGGWPGGGGWRGPVWHGGWPGHHGFRGVGAWGWGGYAPFAYSAGSCVQRQWVWTPYGWRLQWVDACGYGW